MATTIYVRKSHKDLVAALRLLPAMIAGTARDPHGISNGIKAAISMAFFSKVKQAYVVKARGGTDEAGIKWPKLSAKYLAYGRPMRGRKPPKAGGLAPGDKDGFLSKAELAQWRAKFSMVYAMLAARMGPEQAKGIAAASAWKELKEEGAKTKLDVFGKRTDVEILRDRGTLLNSLSPGIIGQAGGPYRKPHNEQVYEPGLGHVVVGTNVPYARAHHKGRGVPQRRLWPDGSRLPATWWEAIFKATGPVVVRTLHLMVGGP